MIKEVAFVAVAVSDLAKARKFYEETLELKAGIGTGRWCVGGIRSWRDDDRRRLSPGLATVARRHDGRLRSGRHRRHDRAAQGTRRDFRHGKNRDAGLLDGAIPRSGREQAPCASSASSPNEMMNQESRKTGKNNQTPAHSWLPDCFPAFLFSWFTISYVHPRR